MFWTYLLENKDDKSWYIGYTSDLKRRLAEHQNGTGCQTTSRKKGWKLIYCEGYVNQKDAEGRERYLKSGAGHTYLKKQMRHYLKLAKA
jgi:putative endonuclease